MPRRDVDDMTEFDHSALWVLEEHESEDAEDSDSISIEYEVRSRFNPKLSILA
jgi:hypothetical protein